MPHLSGDDDYASRMNQNNARILAAELIGTAVLMLGGPGTAILAADSVGILGVSLGFGFSLLIMAYVVGPISGCHINPAVTLGLLLTKKINNQHAIFAVVGQVIGALIGVTIIYGIASGQDGFQRGQFASNLWSGPYFGLGSTIVVEVVLTALLVLVVLSTMGESFPTGFGGIAAGLTLALIHFISIPVDNTSVNPVRSLATALFADQDVYPALEQLWAFIVFPLIGSVVGVLVWLMVHNAKLEDTLLNSAATRKARDTLD